MWIAYGVMSVIFTFLHFVYAMKGKERARWISLCAVSFTALTLLAEYSMINDWVMREDWSALMEVVPSVSTSLTGYAILMIGVNAVAMFLYDRAKKGSP